MSKMKGDFDMLGVRQFNKMVRELGMTLDDENTVIDYEWIALKLWLQHNDEKCNLMSKGREAGVRYEERKCEIIDKYLKKYGEK